MWSWPWTVNVAGKPKFFNSQAEAVAHATAAIKGGTLNVDLGCMQINWRTHGKAFESPAAAMEPGANVNYAAALLATEFRSAGSWSEAVSRYHSRQAHLAAHYRCAVARRLNLPALPSDCIGSKSKAASSRAE